MLPLGTQTQGILFCHLLRFCQLAFQRFQPVTGKFNLIQLLPRAFQKRKDILDSRAIFAAELVDHVQPVFDLLQLVTRKGQSVPKVPHLLCQIHHLIHQVGGSGMQGVDAIVVPCNPRQRALRFHQKRSGAVRIVAAVDGEKGVAQTVG